MGGQSSLHDNKKIMDAMHLIVGRDRWIWKRQNANHSMVHTMPKTSSKNIKAR